MKNTGVIILLAIVLFFSCKKKTEETVNGKIRTSQLVLGGTSGSLLTHCYDDLNRLISREMNSNGSISKTTYEYQPLQVIIRSYGDGTTVSDIDTVLLNSLGLATSYHNSNFTWDSSGHLTMNDNEFDGYTNTWDSQENLIEKVDQNVSLNGTHIRQYTYLLDKLDFRIAVPYFFQGTCSKNLIYNRTDIYSGSGDTITSLYTYEFDEKGRVVKESVDNDNVVRHFTYYD